MVRGGKRLIGPNHCRSEDLLRKSTWSSSCCQRYQRTVVCSGCCAAVVSWIFFTKWCPHFDSRGRGQVDCVPVVASSPKFAGHSRHLPSLGKGKKKVSRSPVKLPRQFEVSSPSTNSRKPAVVDDSSFASALASESPRRKTRISGGDRRASPVFQGGLP